MVQPTNSDLFTIAESAEYLKVSKNTIRNLVLRDQLKAVRVGARIVRIHKTELDALLTPVKGGDFSVWNR